jgi:endonuclease/exonuclease/phosphatase family metal-dependent hydrolase
MRTLAAAVITGLLVLAGLQPSSASTTPGSVGLVSFTAASYSRSTTTAGLTVDWHDARYAKSYQVYISRHYSMDGAKRYSITGSTKTFTGLTPGANYFIQVRAVNGSAVGTRSQRVGHTTIRRMDVASGPTYRVMTYNLCSQKCSNWSTRKPAALQRISAYSPDVIAAQESSELVTPPTGYAQAVDKSAKRLFYKTSRLKVVPATNVPRKPGVDSHNCSTTWDGVTTGWVYLGYHGGGCRYAVWAVLEDLETAERTVFVDVHTVSGDTETRARQREDEITTLTQHMAEVNGEANLRVVYAGDFNSHKNRTNDYLRSVFHRQGYYDAYDLALSLRRQHYNSYNDFSIVPKISYKWGDHVDHVWIRPNEGRILRWNNGALINSSNRMVTPIPSDHSPLLIDVQLN